MMLDQDEFFFFLNPGNVFISLLHYFLNTPQGQRARFHNFIFFFFFHKADDYSGKWSSFLILIYYKLRGNQNLHEVALDYSLDKIQVTSESDIDEKWCDQLK